MMLSVQQPTEERVRLTIDICNGPLSITMSRRDWLMAALEIQRQCYAVPRARVHMQVRDGVEVGEAAVHG